MIVYLGADHRGFSLKEHLKKFLQGQGIAVEDLGAHELLPLDDYPDYAEKVARKVQENTENRGVLFCSNGVGVNIVANKIQGIRSVLGFSKDEVVAARADDNCNVLALPAEYVSAEQAEEIVQAFLQNQFKSEEKYQRRIDKISKIERGQ